MRLKEKYRKQIAPQLKKQFSLDNDFLVPRLDKVVLNVGFGHHAKEREYIKAVAADLAQISGQQPVLTKAKKSISAFKVREGMVIGARVTLRGQRMYDFVEKLVNITFPRVRDFRGLSKKIVDKTCNMTIGFKEHTSFPEIKIENVDNIYGLEVSLGTTANNQEQGLEFFRQLGFPFKKEENK